ncbi:MAG TPA: hypothetical protein VNH18_13625, partial [Bryobacteraceae bacterium]|nr:hypothetical protein [Bryobacteraceae bacterium]
MTEQLFEELDRLLTSADPAGGLDYLIGQYFESGEYGLVFEARLMKKRHELGLPLIQSQQIDREDYQQAVVEAAREAGQLFLSAGNIARAWPYFRAIGESGPVEEAIGRMDGGDDLEAVISIAFQEGVHPRKGLELILSNHGMCRAITAFGMNAVQKDREACIAMLAESLHAEILTRLGAAIEAREGAKPATTSIVEMMEGREWLFGEWDYYVDTSHLLSVVAYSVEVRDPEALKIFHELCEYGQRLASRFQSAGVPPFEKQCEAYGHYVEALRGNDVEIHLDYFRRQVAEADPDVAGDAPGRALTRLLIALGRTEEALRT